MKQKTLKQELEFSGIGLHSGTEVKVRLIPREENYGIKFKRVDLPGTPEIELCPAGVLSTVRSVSVGTKNCNVRTVEHLLAALYAYGVDNLLIEVSGEEIPALDGSALPFAAEIKSHLLEQNADKSYLIIKEPFSFKKGDSFITAHPADELKITTLVNFNHPMVGAQSFDFIKEKNDFLSEVAPARTFGFWEEVESLKERNLALGGSLDNAVVIKQDSIMTKLRFDDEIVRHKGLDLIGDLAVLGKPLKAHIYAYKSSHSLDIDFIKRLPVVKEGTVADINIKEIFGILPHRYPFLLVDRILELENDKRSVGIKNVTINEPFFNGHFPGNPIMPGVLIIEAMAQVGGIMLLNGRRDKKITPFFAGIDKVKFRKAVVPGDQLLIEADVISLRSNQMGKVKVIAKVEDKVVAEGELMFALVVEK
ncbi:MAG: UDP-3-O-acyl-N-acetylglucosamine deacetylase [Armatimonadota bacterium]